VVELRTEGGGIENIDNISMRLVLSCSEGD